MEQKPEALPGSTPESEISIESQETLRILREYVSHGYLLHGSKSRLDFVDPRQARDSNSERVTGKQNAVYATNHVEIALARALLEAKDSQTRSWRSGYSSSDGGKTFAIRGENAKVGYGFVHVLPADTFETETDGKGDDEVLSRVPVVPVAVLEVQPDILELFDTITLELK